LTVALYRTMSSSPQNTLLAAITTIFVFGQLGSSTRRETVFQLIVPSRTKPPISVGQVGSTVPLTYSGDASQVTRVDATASQITSLSTTCWPRMGGHAGSSLAEYPDSACTAL
jgi:hypothetical protein